MWFLVTDDDEWHYRDGDELTNYRGLCGYVGSPLARIITQTRTPLCIYCCNSCLRMRPITKGTQLGKPSSDTKESG